LCNLNRYFIVTTIESAKGEELTTLIFGGAGFIGTNLVEHLASKSKNERVVVFDNLSMGNPAEAFGVKGFELVVGDMTNFFQVLKAIDEYKPTKIYHLAANSDIAASSKNPNFDLDNTLISTVNLVAAMRALNSQADVVFASSSAVYGEHDGPISEEVGPSPISSYGWMKLASERVLEKAHSEGVISKCLIARFPNVTGRYQTHGVIHDLVKKLKANASELKVLGDGTQLKPYALASDLVENLERIIHSEWHGLKKYNFAPSELTSVREIVATIVNVSTLNPRVVFGTEPFGWKGDINRYELDCSKVESDFGQLTFRTSSNAIIEATSWAWQNINE
jgi:UDP-glucose 4-epimerase